jgi:hypothetical protein
MMPVHERVRCTAADKAATGIMTETMTRGTNGGSPFRIVRAGSAHAARTFRGNHSPTKIALAVILQHISLGQACATELAPRD